MTAMSSVLFTMLVLGMAGLSFAFPDRTRDATLNRFQNYQDQHFNDSSQGTRAKICPKPPRKKLTLKIDFEGPTDTDTATYFTIVPNNNPDHQILRKPLYHKSGDYSLHWQWPATTTNNKVKLVLDLGRKKRKRKTEMTRGGIKFWMYRANEQPSSTMQIIFVGKDELGARTRSSPTNVNLNFKGWRAVWIGYQEFKPGQFNLKKLIKIEFVVTSNDADSLYIDLIQFVKGIGKQSRDVIVREVGQPISSRSNTPPFYSEKDFWQRSLRWYDETVSRSTQEILDKATKIEDITKIESRLENWYLSKREPITLLEDYVSGTDTDGGYDFKAAKKSRWSGLSTDISEAHEQFNKIQFSQKRPPLFTKVSDFGEDDIKGDATAMTKFGFIFFKVLLPLSIEYNFMSRDVEKQHLKNAYCSVLQTTDITADHEAVIKIAGKDNFMKGKFKEMVDRAKAGPETLNCDAVIDELNDLRFKRIKDLLEFLQDQGWAEGSGLGSIDHEMNKAGSGFMHSMFLLRHKLRQEPALFNSLLGAMKWYNDFNEIYQDDSNYIYDGTTADRIRTILLYRLFIILIDNANKDDQILNLENFKTWTKHALRINKGLGGVFKPDYTGFHHKTFYGSAYVPHALHNAALVQYLLDGTSFALEQESKDNLRKALEVLRIVAVKYSTPNGLCGRFPSYTSSILAYHVPAYAYSSYVHAHGSTPEGTDKPQMYLRLFEPAFKIFGDYLKDGEIKSGIYYWNTIGSLDVLKKAKTLPCNSNPPCSAERSPSGHWSKNFAALSIHRRQDWSVAVKGMNRYTWDYESSGKENVFGVFGSHGSLQISNSEEYLKAYDVDNGWDWTRVPGTTTIEDVFNKIKTNKARNYNYKGKFAGGVSFIGSSARNPQNGAFGMYFKKPDYKMTKKLKTSPLAMMEFEFKKSYFFYNNLIVCLGSDIKLGNVNIGQNYAQTTIFQDKFVVGSSDVYIGTTRKDSDFRKRWDTSDTVLLKDTNGNTYKVETGENILVAKVGNQNSKKSNGCDRSSDKYAVAYIKHRTTTTTTPTETYNYQYAILVAGGNQDMLSNYRIIRKDENVHAIELANLPGLDSQIKIFGYSVFNDFEGAPLDDGPVISASAKCMIMAEKGTSTLHLAISDPDISFGDDPNMTGKQTCTVQDKNAYADKLNPKTSENVGSYLMYCVEGQQSIPVTVALNVGVQRISSVKVDGETPAEDISMHVLLDNTDSSKSKLTFKNLVNGFTTEVMLALA